MESQMQSVGQDFPSEMARVRKIQSFCSGIGVPGVFLFTLCEKVLQNADEAWRSGDAVRILAAYKEMKEIKE